MRPHLEAIVSELKRRRVEGESYVYMGDDTLAVLRESVAPGQTPLNSPAKQTTPVRSAQPNYSAAPAEPSYHKTSTMPTARPTAKPAAPAVTAFPASPQFTLSNGTKQERWNWLRDKVISCPVCNKHARIADGKKVVFGVGNLDAKIFFCGEAPGADEETQGEPFVGKAGQLLNKIIAAMGLNRSDVYIGNILNWRPEMPNMASGNRPPTLEEMAYCLPYLIGQIEIVQPQVIVALGNTAVTGLLGPDPKRRMGKIRGHWHDFRGTPLMPTYHPSYLLQYASQKAKREVWEDMMQTMDKVGLPISKKQRGFFLEK